MDADRTNADFPTHDDALRAPPRSEPLRQRRVALSWSAMLAAACVLARSTVRSKLAHGFRSGTLSVAANVLGHGIFLLVWLDVIESQPERLEAGGFLRGYLVAALSLNTALTLSVEARCWQRINRGMISIELLKPLPFQLYQLAQAVGDVLVNVLYAVPAYLVGWALLGGPAALNLEYVASAAVSLVLAFIINFGVSYSFVLVAFVTHSSYGLMNARLAMHQAFSGCVAPLYMFPEALRDVASCLPFRHIIETPLLIGLGATPRDDVVRLILQQAGWAAFLLLLGAAAFQRALRWQQMSGG